MSTRGDLGYPDEDDENWRQGRPDTTRTAATKAAGEIGAIAALVELTRDEKLAALGLTPTGARTPEGRPVCRVCGKEAWCLHSVAGEVVIVDGMRVVGTVRTTCGPCICSGRTVHNAARSVQ